jgi:hypothetical protein
MKATMKKQHLHAWKTVQSVSSHSFPELDGSKETRPSPFLPFQTSPHQAILHSTKISKSCVFGTKRQPKVPEIFANDLSYGRTEEQADRDHFQKNDY